MEDSSIDNQKEKSLSDTLGLNFLSFHVFTVLVLTI